MVTASSSGIGVAVAKRLSQEGVAVLVHGRNVERTEAVAADLRAHGGTAEVVLGDLTGPEADHVVERARDWEPDIVVNNAGPFVENTWETADPAAWLAAFDANVVSAVRMIRPLIPTMRERGWGRIVNIGTRAATVPQPNIVAYSAAKAALVNLTTSLAQELAGSGITANTVSPGVMATDGLRQMFEQRAAADGRTVSWAELEPGIVADYAPNPTGRLGTGDDIAAAIALIVSPLGGYINGTELRVDGGITPIA